MRLTAAGQRCVLVALTLPWALMAHAQVAGTIGLASENRYRGSATNDRGPVFRASVLWDSQWPATAGAYGGVSGLWRTEDGRATSAEALLGFSGRFNATNAFSNLDARWGWDVGAHRLHYRDEPMRRDFNELTAALLMPGWSLRTWWTLQYFGHLGSSLYTEVNGSHDIDDHWRVFVHLGSLRYGKSANGAPRIPGRTDAMAGASYIDGDWEFRLSRDERLSGPVPRDLKPGQRGPAWVLSATFAF